MTPMEMEEMLFIGRGLVYVFVPAVLLALFFRAPFRTVLLVFVLVVGWKALL